MTKRLNFSDKYKALEALEALRGHLVSWSRVPYHRQAGACLLQWIPSPICNRYFGQCLRGDKTLQ